MWGPGRGRLGSGVLFALPRTGWESTAGAGSPGGLTRPTGHRGCGWEAGSNFQKDVGEGHHFPCGWRWVRSCNKRSGDLLSLLYFRTSENLTLCC